eukprot:9157149-Heterocapsa_arctica.AAC.1
MTHPSGPAAFRTPLWVRCVRKSARYPSGKAWGYYGMVRSPSHSSTPPYSRHAGQLACTCQVQDLWRELPGTESIAEGADASLREETASPAIWSGQGKR